MPREPDQGALVPGEQPGTFRDKMTGELWALPSSFGTFDTVGPVTRDEFHGLVARVDAIAPQVVEKRPEAIARMVAQITEGVKDG